MKVTGTHVTLLLGIAAVGAAYFVGKRAADAAGRAGEGLFNALEYGVQQITPWNHDNVFASTVNKVGGALVTDPQGPGKNADGSWTLGAFAYDVTAPVGVTPAGMVLPAVGVAQVITTGVKALGSAIADALPGRRKVDPSDWAQPTQYDELGNVIFYPYP